MHTCGLPKNEEVMPCNTQQCCSRLPWSGWTECSTSCGPVRKQLTQLTFIDCTQVSSLRKAATFAKYTGKFSFLFDGLPFPLTN